MSNKVVLVTGGAVRIGAAIARQFHSNGWNVVISYLTSVQPAATLSAELNSIRADSAALVKADLRLPFDVEWLVAQSAAKFGRLDSVINNASFMPSDEDLEKSPTEWNGLFWSNAITPHWITRNAMPYLAAVAGSVVNLLDVRTVNQVPLAGYSAYSASKSALLSFTRSDAKEFAPLVRINAVAPGVTLPPPDREWTIEEEERIRQLMPLKKFATIEDIAEAVFFMATAPHVTGQILTVDGGESIGW